MSLSEYGSIAYRFAVDFINLIFNFLKIPNARKRAQQKDKMGKREVNIKTSHKKKKY